jgi:hypothetical protein
MDEGIYIPLGVEIRGGGTCARVGYRNYTEERCSWVHCKKDAFRDELDAYKEAAKYLLLLKKKADKRRSK